MVRAVILVALAACHAKPTAPDACAPAVLYLDRTGGTWDHGAHDDPGANRSLLVDEQRVVPPYPKDDADWSALVACMTAQLSAFPLAITEMDPGSAPHAELVFTTSYWAGNAGTSSIIPDACGRDHRVAFIFGDALATRARACDVALRTYAQMIADLSFDDRCDDILNNQVDCVPQREFLRVDANCIDDFGQPTACRCGGTTQNSFAAMSAALPACN